MKTKQNEVNEVQHTPTPWFISGEENGIVTIRGDKASGRLFAVADTLKREDAEMIVRAVNSYEALLAFAKAVMPTVKKNLPDFSLVGERVIAEAEGK